MLRRRAGLLVSFLHVLGAVAGAQEAGPRPGLEGAGYVAAGAALRSAGDADVVVSVGAAGRYWLAKPFGIEGEVGYTLNVSASASGYVVLSPGLVLDLAPDKPSTVLVGAGYAVFVSSGDLQGLYFGLGYRPETRRSHPLTFEIRDYVMGLWDIKRVPSTSCSCACC